MLMRFFFTFIVFNFVTQSNSPFLDIFINDRVCKPSFVLGSYLSRHGVAADAQCHLPEHAEQTYNAPSTVLLQIGFTDRQGFPAGGELLPRLSILT